MTEPFELPDDPTTAPYWSAALRGQLTLQQCTTCGHTQHYPRPVCLRCGALDLEWRESAGVGSVYSVTTVAMKVADLEPPYVVTLVDLDEGPRVLGLALDESVTIGCRVRAEWRQRPDALPRLYVRPEQPEGQPGWSRITASGEAGSGAPTARQDRPGQWRPAW